MLSLHKHIKKHVTTHHKKYLSGALFSGLLSHLLIFKVVALKLFLMKVILLGITSVGILEGMQHQAFADLESICINNIAIVENGICESNYNSIQEAISALEEESLHKKANIDNDTQIDLFQGVLQNYCNDTVIAGADATIQIFSDNFDSYIDKLVLHKKLDYLDGFYEKLLSAGQRIYSNNTKNYCKQKYVLFGLEKLIQDRYMGILEEHGLAGKELLWSNMNEDKNKILLPVLETQLKSSQKVLRSAEILEDIDEIKNIDVKAISMHDLGNEETQILKDKVIEVTENSVKKVLAKMLEQNIIDLHDITLLKNKISVKYLWGCQATQGSYTIQKDYNGTTLMGASLKNLNINVNLCPSFHYLSNLDSYVEEIFTHEMGHHIYYFHDEKPKNFERICRTNRKQNKCEIEDYVSNYASSMPEEDYAETFLHRYQNDFQQKKTDNLSQKIAYFSNLLSE